MSTEHRARSTEHTAPKHPALSTPHPAPSPLHPAPLWPIVRDALAGASPGVRRQIRWIVVFWAVMLALQSWDSRNAHGAAGVAEFLSAVLGATGVALLGLSYTLNLTMIEASARKRPDEAEAVQQVLLALPSTGFTAGVALGSAALLMAVRAALGAELPFALTGLTVYTALMVLAARTVSRSSLTLFQHATHHAAAAAQARSDAALAQLAALQARMNPHFLFNALNTVASLVRSNPAAAEQVVENLSDVLRRTMERSAATMGTVEEEIDYVRSYLALEQERRDDRLHVVWNVEDAARSRALPPLVLQPLVENALRHGLGGRLTGGHIRISVRAPLDETVVSVEDDGIGFPRNWREGMGLGNLRQRLRTLYGDDARLTAESTADGALVTVTVPADTLTLNLEP
jgi:signal transduction histidine kinase